ncbi:hypothetical protein LVD15_22820 [Fulvivirga maritima]|uniref:hypothetical protein n=1 Tax=Fulvivirga maritima TaxID=2904247 RepID=UPI001F35CF1C|nr:hypothetical protein [Fulvivirga maritima]UII26107.1 hypothetical protein LVD15_22820 [Fulvivirga maritima]
MANNYNVGQIKTLLIDLTAKYGLLADHHGLSSVWYDCGLNIGERYLYEVWQKCEKSESEEISLAQHNIELLVNHLGYNNFDHFVSSKSPDIHESLLAMEGKYYSYLRMNNKQQGYILQSPVEINHNVIEKRMAFLLNGPKRQYTGELSFAEGAMTALIRGDGGKMFFHIYKLGKTTAPDVIQGTFAGTSMGNDPIAGRCVLVKQSGDDELSNLKFSIADLNNSSEENYKALARYFKDFEDNNISINHPTSYGIEDLY